MFQTDFKREDNRVVLRFLESKQGFLFLRKKIEEHDLREWSVRTGASGSLAHAEITRLMEERKEQVIETGNRLIIYDKALAQLSSNALKAFGLPPKLSFTFRLEQRGSLATGDFVITPLWQHQGENTRVKRDGAFLTHSRSDESYIIPDPIFGICTILDEYKTSSDKSVARQMQLAAKVLALIRRPAVYVDPLDDATPLFSLDQEGNSADDLKIRLDDTLSRFTVKTATAISFDVSFKNKHGYHIKPVLFGKVPDAGKSPASEKQGLLTQEERLTFENDPRKGFFSSTSAKPTYLLESGEYILIDELLFPVFEHVRNIDTASSELREIFATNPAEAIAEIYRSRLESDETLDLPDDIQQEQVEQIISSIFVETKEYSDRVTELGLWVPPVVPWVKRKPNSWEPEEFGIYLGDQFVVLPTDKIEDLKAELSATIQKGEKIVRHEGHDIPATEEVKAILDQLIGIAKPTAKPDQIENGGEEPKVSEQKVLLIKDNFDELKYRCELTERPRHIHTNLSPMIITMLMEHQDVSLDWQIDAYLQGLPGVLNADDQGLGKTLQTIAFMAWLQENMRKAPSDQKKPILVVAPTTLLKNWATEVETHMGSWLGLGSRIDVYGSGLKRLKKVTDDDTYYLDLGLDTQHEDDRICWVLTTYQTLAQNQVEFAKIDFAAVVYDEIQNVKNVTTLAHRAVQSMKADFTIGLTGTPVENEISELWAIMDTIAPGSLGSLREFVDRFKNADKARYRELHQEIFANSYSDVSSGKPIATIGIRRMKSDTVKVLPLKKYRFYATDMPEIQARAYDMVFADLKNHVHGRALKILHQLRTVSLYPGNLQQLDNQPNALETMMERSARIKAAVKILDDVRDRGEKVLLFLETHEMQHLLRRLLRERYGVDDIPILNGQTTPQRRGNIVEEFKQTRGDGQFAIRILSPKSAGIGITMIAATHIVHLSRWWNPAVEEQCNDRIYRIGQDMDCTIHIPITVHPHHQDASFDCILNDIMVRKRKLFRDVLMPSEDGEADQGAMISGMTKSKFDIQKIDGLDWKEFELWSGREAQRSGNWRMSRTPCTGDGGLDTHLVNLERGDVILVQCKFTDDHEKFMSAKPVQEVLNSVNRYDVSKGYQCVVLTNANGFDNQAKRLAAEKGVKLIDRHRLSMWPNHII